MGMRSERFLSRTYRQHRFERPKGATEIILVRHGESAPFGPDAPVEQVDGQDNPPLHEDGWGQALAVSNYLGHLPISAIYTSNLRRAQQTAEPLAAVLELEVIADSDLRELHLGEWEGGHYRAKVDSRDPAYLRMLKEQRWDAIPGAESNEAFEARLMRAIRHIAATYPDQIVAVFSHGGAIAQIVACCNNTTPLAGLGIENGSITRLLATPKRIRVRTVNEIAHLELAAVGSRA